MPALPALDRVARLSDHCVLVDKSAEEADATTNASTYTTRIATILFRTRFIILTLPLSYHDADQPILQIRGHLRPSFLVQPNMNYWMNSVGCRHRRRNVESPVHAIDIARPKTRGEQCERPGSGHSHLLPHYRCGVWRRRNRSLLHRMGDKVVLAPKGEPPPTICADQSA